MIGHNILGHIGGVIIWTYKRFQGEYMECFRSKYSFFIGFIFLFIVVIIFSF